MANFVQYTMTAMTAATAVMTGPHHHRMPLEVPIILPIRPRPALQVPVIITLMVIQLLPNRTNISPTYRKTIWATHLRHHPARPQHPFLGR